MCPPEGGLCGPRAFGAAGHSHAAMDGGNRSGGSFVSSVRMQHGRGVALAVALAGTLAWSPPASACGGSGFGAGMVLAAMTSLLIVLLMSIVSLVSTRAAARTVGRMRALRDSRGLRVGHAAIVLGLGISAVSTILSGGLLLALVLLV
jgi:hypothetical protein